ncbi:hypothetical protein TCAL_03831 [Tigriopus californicus]|uniref:Protein-lysine N-methyltransferase TCAL_03831 n=2 Tax=Tigriopus californicus TaxID=6832 RepID=A0A553PGR6_TIGCA|nr:hypothetical protein TCAL_03831 [Tigriopus californicus]
MHRAFTTAYAWFRPELVIFLGDLFDEGKWCAPDEFEYYVRRFQELFPMDPKQTLAAVVAGNHDIGFHYSVTPYLNNRFERAFEMSSVDRFSLKGVHFVSVNSMAMEGDDCFLCSKARDELTKISGQLQCLARGNDCDIDYDFDDKTPQYSRPVLLQHFPLFRESDAACNEEDAAPASEKYKRFREKWDCLSRNASQTLLDVLNPRLVLSGHTHHGCRVKHERDIWEWSVSSFSWRNRNNPTLLTVAMALEGDNDDLPTLSAETFAALQQFYNEEDSREKARLDIVQADAAAPVDYTTLTFDEDWQLSQFWYDEATSNALADICLAVAENNPGNDPTRIACLSCPTLFLALKKRHPQLSNVILFEFDKRFSKLGQDFTFYDYKSPLDVPREWREYFDLVVADPPFLSGECLTKTAVTMKFLSKGKMILCTGATMADMADRLLHLKKQEFIPGHRNNLANEFRCFANFDMKAITNKDGDNLSS